MIERYKREVSFLRVFVNHYSFVTGLVGKLAGRDGSPEDSSVGVNVLLNATIKEGFRVIDPIGFPLLEEAPYHNVLQGNVFQCCDLLSFIAGTFDSKELKSLNENKKRTATEFVIETWTLVDDENPCEWQLTKKTFWNGVKWLDAAHTTDGGDRCCAGVATFTCTEKIEQLIEAGEVVVVPETEYPHIRLRDVLKENMAGPKHPASYLG